MNEYITDAFTREGNNTNLEVNNLNVGCITSTNNKFELDSNGNLTVQGLTVQNQNIDTITMRDFIYPVGSIYMSVNGTNPSTLFGGTWEQLKYRFLLGCGDTYQNGTTGGEATHKLTTEELASHSHSYYRYSTTTAATASGQGQILDANKRWSAAAGSNTNLIFNSGGDQPHNNMPPYLVVYMWKRVS